MKYILVLVFCLFMGVLGISLGIGTAYPPLNSIAKPVVCPDGEMNYKQHSRNTAPGTTYGWATWTCDSPAGSTPISNVHICLFAGSVYGFALFVLFAIPMVVAGRRRRPPRQ